MKRTIEGDTLKALDGYAKAWKKGNLERARKHARRLRQITEQTPTKKDIEK